MVTDAISKLKTEITESKNPYVQLVGQFLLQHLEQNPDDAACILKTDKSITKSLDAMRKVAEKKRVGNMAVLSDDEGFAIVLNYFKAEEQAPADKKAEPGAKKQAEPEKPVKPEQEASEDSEEDFDFDDLLQ